MDKYTMLNVQAYKLLLDAIDENKRCPMLAIGDYSNAYIMRIDNLDKLYDEYLSGDYGNDSFDVFKDKILKEHATFGDIQQVLPVDDMLQELKKLLCKYSNSDTNPQLIADDDDYKSCFKVWINGKRVSLMDDMQDYNESFTELVEYLDELNNL